jgi:hypothetical protein
MNRGRIVDMAATPAALSAAILLLTTATAVSVQSTVSSLCQTKFRYLRPRSWRPARVVDQQRSFQSFAYSCLKKGGTLSEVPACRVMGLRAFGRGLPIGDSANFVIDLDEAGYWQNYQIDSRKRLLERNHRARIMRYERQ